MLWTNLFTKFFIDDTFGSSWVFCYLEAVKTVPEAENDDSAQLVILSTTDMHGKCWEENVLTESAVEQNMLRVSTAVGEIRSRYGDDHVILIDNGDT